MITAAIFHLLGAVITFVVSPLPVSGFGTMVTTVPAYVSSGSGWLGFMNSFLPVAEMVSAFGVVVTYWLPAVIVYHSVSWVYRHIPMIGGG